jgi:ABC-2 type transport system permease protein
MKQIWTLTKFRITIAMRNRAFLFFGVIIPVGLLFLFSAIFGQGGGSRVAYVLASILSMTVMGSFWGLSQQLVIFREQGILRRFRLTPAGAGAMLASSILSNFALTLPAVVLELVLARWLLHMTGSTNIGGLAVLVTLGSSAFATLGLVVASVANSMMETQIINQLLWLAFMLLSGVTIPLPSLPVWVQNFAMFLPATYLVTGLQGALIRNASPSILGEEILALGGSTILAFFISRQIFRWEPEEKLPSRAKWWTVAALVPFLLMGGWETKNGHRRDEARVVLESTRERPAPATSAPRP